MGYLRFKYTTRTVSYSIGLAEIKLQIPLNIFPIF